MNQTSKLEKCGVLFLLVTLLLGINADGQTNAARTGIFYRGTGTNTTLQSFVIPLDFQKGVALDNIAGNSTNWFPNTNMFGIIQYHYNATNISQRIPCINPIAAFGGRVGGSPLFFNQEYHFGVYAGETGPYSESALYIRVYRQSDLTYVGQYVVPVPLLTDTNVWRSFLTNGYQQTITGYGLTTTVRFDDPLQMWGVTGAGCYHLTQTATQTATNYIYSVLLMGYAAGAWMSSLDNGGATNAWSRLYSLEFQPRPQWRALLLDQPQFTGTPAPSFYQGMALSELLTNAPQVTNTITLSPSACTNLDASPELRRHPTLDQFVANLGNDPMALANYVQNEIELTDGIAYNDIGSVSDTSINLGGVNRSALGTFLEGQGSPTEQCALLVYLLRAAGVPAVYVFPPHNGVKMLDTQLSKLLHMQIHGAINFYLGSKNQPYTTNTLIAVNYPWVAAYIGTNWVHLFPWMKDTEVTEGLNTFDYMPTNYSAGYQWARDYLYGKTNIMGLSAQDDTPQTLFSLFLKQSLAANAPGISMDDLGVQIINRRHLYSRWTDFPRPPSVTNACTSIESLGSSAITNVYAGLTNIFDTISVTVSSVTNPATKLVTGTLRMVDLHNRKLLIRHEKVTSTQHRMIMSLEPYRPSATGIGSFTNDALLLNQQSVTNLLGTTDDSLNVQIVYNRHRFLPTGFVKPDHDIPYLGMDEVTTVQQTRPMRKGDLSAICLSVGRVTPAMLQVHAQQLWNMESTLKSNPSATNTLSPEIYQGSVAYLMGMAYYEKLGRFDRTLQHLTKVAVQSEAAMGLASIRAARTNNALPSGNIDLVLPSVDMFFQEVTYCGNGTIHLNSGDDGIVPNDDYFQLFTVDGSAQEHAIINHYFQQTDAISTVKLLQLAQAKSATNGQPGIVFLDYNNYVATGNSNYPTGGTTKLKNQDAGIWTSITNAFTSYSYSNANYVQVYITPGPITNQTVTFKGMGALIIQPNNIAAYISQKLNGGVGANNPPGSLASGNTPNMSLSVDPDNNYAINLASPGSGNTTLAPDAFANFDSGSIANNASLNYYNYTPVQAVWTSQLMDALAISSLGSQSLNFSQSIQADNGNSGFLGRVGDGVDQFLTQIADPVQTVTGEFYIDETDLKLPGPIPLSLRRNYSSQNLADNQFGCGWKFSIMPYLSIGNGGTNIYAADMDGAVLAYVRTATNANVWLPTPAANPQLNNNTTAGVGGLVNRLRDRLILTGTTNYTLFGANGSVRAFQTMTFNSGVINQTRPYLTQWTDSCGNYYTFTYGTDSTQANFAQTARIQCSNGNYLGFDYDVYGHVIDAYSGDGRWLYYDYDKYGDLVTVTLPDASTRSYQYLHGTQSVTNGATVTQQSYSTHLIIEEDKPDGRELINVYDSQRRVTNQLSTAGVDLNPIRTATFVYSNNFNVTNSYTNAITGYTLIIDGNNHTNRYDYTNSLIAKITDPLGQTIQQTWYADNATAPGYPRSVATRADKRGLITQFKYDANGNVTNTIVTGDLTGDGISSQTATNTAVYNTNNLPLQMTDPAGNSAVYVYDPTFTFLPQQIIRYAGTTAVSTNYLIYGNATNVIVNGSTTQTNRAFGLIIRQVRAYGSPDAATNDLAHDGHGYITQSIRYSGTGDPNVTNTFFYNARGNPVIQMDALGASAYSDYDGLDRPTENERFDEHGNALSWRFSYYNENGELNWMDGPRYNPEDYIFFDYDGAGRPTTEIHWRSEAKADATGMEPPAGDNLYAQTFYQYDPLGNLTLKVDPRGAMTTNTWDAICRLVQKKHLDTNGITVLSTEGFGYEPGGQVHYYTNALSGVTTKLYTITGKPEFQSNPDGSTNGWRYYLDGRINKEIQSNSAYWQTTYDDINLITTRIFYSAAGVPEATNSVQLDRRGNVIQRVDAGGNAFTTVFDGLDRAKITAGPAIVTVIQNGGISPTGPYTYTTNVLQQTITNFYDAAGRVFTNVNALGEKTVTLSDAIGRTTQTQIFSAAGTLVRQKSMAYSADHNSVTTTNGSGASAIVNTAYTDNDGHNVLSIAYPSGSVNEFNLSQYDLAGNLVSAQHDSSASGTVTTWTTTSLAYDGLNRPTSKSDRDNALTTYVYNPMSDLTNRTMPGGLQWQAIYNNAGQMLQERNFGGSIATRTNTYSYFSSGNVFAGLLQTKTDGRGVSCTYLYDDWLRPTNMAYSGSLPEQNLTTAWQYEPRGFVIGITEQFASTNTEPNTAIQRSYDPYGQLASESVSTGSFGYGTSQSFDAAGRRSQLGIGSGSYGFGWQADGNLISVGDLTGGGAYSYDTTGLLTTRTVDNRYTSISSRDGEGRPLSIATTVNAVTQLSESLSWLGDGLLASHTLVRGDSITDSRAYSYASLSRRLVQEQLNLNASSRWTNTLVYDNGISARVGVLTQMGQASGTSNRWSGVADAFLRINTETNNTFQYSAYGHANGPATFSGWLDNQPIPLTAVGSQTIQWRAMMELSPGIHKLQVSAQHPSGQFTAWATNTFTNNIAYQTTADSYDSAGNVTQRIWKNSSGTTNRTQTLSWDGRGRLYAVTERDASNSGYNWTATYDGLSRRLTTTSVLVTNGVALTLQPTTINSYFDPKVEFLELGVSYGITTEWKLYGPDLNGVYGGLNGTGGLDAVSPYLNLFNPVISDFRGNILAVLTNGVVSWNPARPTGYGAVPGYRPLALANGANVAQSSAWRGHWVDITGYHQIGLRPYDSISGRWLTYDSLWNERDPNYYSFAGGDPIMGFDADGRLTSNYYNTGGPTGQALREVAGLFDYVGNNTSSSALGGYADYQSTILNELAGAITPANYVNGASSFGNNVSSVYQSDSFLAAGSYATTSWNVGAVYSGFANLDLATGQPVGDWWQRGEAISSGVANTAGLSLGGARLLTMSGVTAPAENFAAQTYLNYVDPANGASLYNSFASGTARLNIEFGGQTLFRAANDLPSATFGEFASVERPATSAEAIQGNALSPGITSNQASSLYQVQTRFGFSVQGIAAPQGVGYPGGFTQVFQNSVPGIGSWQSVTPVPYLGH